MCRKQGIRFSLVFKLFPGNAALEAQEKYFGHQMFKHDHIFLPYSNSSEIWLVPNTFVQGKSFPQGHLNPLKVYYKWKCLKTPGNLGLKNSPFSLLCVRLVYWDTRPRSRDLSWAGRSYKPSREDRRVGSSPGKD